jgi:hypothetical protein
LSLQERVRLLRVIINNLGLKEIPAGIVSRRMSILRAFDENEQAFSSEQIIDLLKTFLNDDKIEKITASMILSIINDNQDLWEEALKKPDDLEEPEETDEGVSGLFGEVIERNRYIFTKIQEKSAFLEYLLKNLTLLEPIPYPVFEKETLLYLEPHVNLDNNSLLDEALRRYIQIVYKDDPEIGHRLIFEEIRLNGQLYEKLGLILDYPTILARGGVQRLMESMDLASSLGAGVFEYRRIISVANKIAGVRFTEEELIDFFKTYIEGSLESILLNPPEGKSYFKRVKATQDYKFEINLRHVGPKISTKHKELTSIFNNLMDILMRIKIVEWGQNIPLGEEKTILDLLFEIQRDLLNIIPQSSENLVDLLPLDEMFVKTDQNIIKLVVEHYSKQHAYSYLLRLRKGGIRNIIFNSFRNLGGSTEVFGKQLLDIRNYYQVIYPDSWQERLYYKFILNTASKGLSSSPKKTVRERLNLLVYPEESRLSAVSSKKIPSDEIFDAIRNQIPFLIPYFSTSDEAQDYFNQIFALVKIVLNRVWIQKILRVGFELYIETPVQRVWTKEMIDLSRELIRYYQTLIAIKQKQSKINELVFDSLTEALEGVPSLNKDLIVQETLTLFTQLPERPVLLDSVSVDAYLDHVFACAKTIINNILGRQVEKEVERKTFDQEMDERIASLENKVNDWFIKGYQYYDGIISEPMSLENTSDPTEILNKAIYGGIFFLIEESMKGLMLTDPQKTNKARFFKELFFKQVSAIRDAFSHLYHTYNVNIIINFVLEQIKIFDTAFQLRGLLIDLEADNRFIKALSTEVTRSDDDQRVSQALIFEPGIRSIIARELVIHWIRKWANSVLNLVESCLNDYLKEVIEEERDEAEQEAIKLLFDSTGRNDICNFIAPVLVGNTLKVLSFENCQLSDEFLQSKYTHEVFPEAVQCDAQLTMYFLSNLLLKDLTRKRKLNRGLDFIYYKGNEIQSCRRTLLGTGGETSSLSDVVKKATGLSLSGLTLETVVFRFGRIELFSAASYCENPFEGSQLTGLALELISKENIPLSMLHPLAKNASETIAGLFERNPENISEPDALFNIVVRQLLDEANLVLLKDSGTIKDRKLSIESDMTHVVRLKDISRVMLRPTAAYEIKIIKSDENSDLLIPEEVSYYGEKLINFNRFVHLIVPFFEPGAIIKNRLLTETQFLKNLEITDKRGLEEAAAFPSLAVFDDNGKYQVIIGILGDNGSKKFILTTEDESSNMGLITIQYLLRTRDFEELTKDFGLWPLNKLNQSFPLNQVRVIREKKGKKILDIDFINNIGLGAI